MTQPSKCLLSLFVVDENSNYVNRYLMASTRKWETVDEKIIRVIIIVRVVCKKSSISNQWASNPLH